jgi:hypothetical protein
MVNLMMKVESVNEGSKKEYAHNSKCSEDPYSQCQQRFFLLADKLDVFLE